MKHTDEEFIKIGINKLKSCQRMSESGNLEKAHRKADYILVHILRRLGQFEVANQWKKVGKWYS